MEEVPVVVVSSSDAEEEGRSGGGASVWRGRSSKRKMSRPRAAPGGGKRRRTRKKGEGPSTGEHQQRAEQVDFDFLSEDFFECLGGLHPVPDTKELWVDKYKPSSLAELAVNKKKVEEVRLWLEERVRATKVNFNPVNCTNRKMFGITLFLLLDKLELENLPPFMSLLHNLELNYVNGELPHQPCGKSTSIIPIQVSWFFHASTGYCFLFNIQIEIFFPCLMIFYYIPGSNVGSLKEKFRRLQLKMDAPENVLYQAHAQARPIVDFLHENVLDFLSDEAIDDAWTVASYLSDADCLLATSISKTWSQITKGSDGPEILSQSVAASVSVRGVLFGNSQPLPSRWHSIRRPKLWQIEQSSRRNKNLIASEGFQTCSFTLTTISDVATEYKPMIRWLGSVSPQHPLLHEQLLQSCSVESGDIDGDCSEIDHSPREDEDDDIEEW
ncbi:hypothetical protein Taro_003003 [Colocasia esculenta]|uniref:Uncharacterized protein n=1 Tax=Colocasia esculenta TaxID=4460 RepID=A0A843TMG2_COLES|nr:hypothetical protein [Colocasia esculenta]